MLQAWNIRTNAEFNLNGPVGQVHAMVVANEMLFAGAQVMTVTVLQVPNNCITGLLDNLHPFINSAI